MKHETSKAVFWNIWGHRHADGIHDYIEKHVHDTDIFCLTEVTDIDKRAAHTLGTVLCHGDRADEAASQVNGHHQLMFQFQDRFSLHYMSATRGRWTCTQTGTIFNDVGFGSLLMLKHGLTRVGQGNLVLELGQKHAYKRALQWVVYRKGWTTYLVAHLHGVWIKGNTKGDSVERTQQSELVLFELNRVAREYGADKIIFGGDLNLDIDTNAVAILESYFARNLIKEYEITNTRTTAYRNFHEADSCKYADYIFTDYDVAPMSFEVDNSATASDHAPLIVSYL